MALQTEFQFTLPRGYIDKDGNLHKEGIMRLATAADEIFPQKDSRVQSNPAYLTVILLARVITKLGKIQPNTEVIENLFASDLSYLQDLYRRINENGSGKIKTTCPKCEHNFEVEIESPGE
ncbi:MAG: phage tail assembly protein [Candidatus Methanoperedens sp.]